MKRVFEFVIWWWLQRKQIASHPGRSSGTRSRVQTSTQATISFGQRSIYPNLLADSNALCDHRHTISLNWYSQVPLIIFMCMLASSSFRGSTQHNLSLQTHHFETSFELEWEFHRYLTKDLMLLMLLHCGFYAIVGIPTFCSAYIEVPHADFGHLPDRVQPSWI